MGEIIADVLLSGWLVLLVFIGWSLYRINDGFFPLPEAWEKLDYESR